MNSVQPDVAGSHDFHQDERPNRHPPPLAANQWPNNAAPMNNRFFPYERRKHLHLGYFKKPRGIVKILQLVIALIAMLAYSDCYGHFDAAITRSFCPVLIVFALFFAIAYSGFPHLAMREEANRNGLLYAELISSTFSSLVLLSLLACRFVLVIAHRQSLTDILLLPFVQLPLTAIYIYELSVLLRQWVDVNDFSTIMQSVSIAPKPQPPPRTVFSSSASISSTDRFNAHMRPAELSVPAAEIA
uniref:MARVEL domain-containing protein n=1 Tax=Plectus sambesii TaxID=2011161 RepID=A0A914ULX4_9BILA